MAFHGERVRFGESQGWTTACNCMYPNVGVMTKERVLAQRKVTRPSSLAKVDQPQAAPTRVLINNLFYFFAFIKSVALRSVVLRYA